jgi:hypothetical protein
MCGRYEQFAVRQPLEWPPLDGLGAGRRHDRLRNVRLSFGPQDCTGTLGLGSTLLVKFFL